jgi:hypothetical protein
MTNHMISKRMFSDSAQVQATQEESTGDVTDISLNKRVGADEQFDEQKHAYVLTFPWNFEEVISEFDTSSQVGAYWDTFINNSRSVVDFNNLFREFH